MRSRHDSCGRKSAHFRDPAFLECARARFERGPRRAHIIDEHHDSSSERPGGPRRNKGAAHVAVAAASRQAGLRRRRADAPKSRADRDAQLPREIGGLIEAPFPSPRRVERHRDGGVDAFQKIPASIAHQRGQRAGKRSPSVVLQRVDDGPERPFVGADRAGPIDVAADAPATRAPRQGHADRSPRRQRIAAAIAQRRGQRENRKPAPRTHRPVCRAIERRVARCARGREQNGQQGIAEPRAGYSRPYRLRIAHGALQLTPSSAVPAVGFP